MIPVVPVLGALGLVGLAAWWRSRSSSSSTSSTSSSSSTSSGYTLAESEQGEEWLGPHFTLAELTRTSTGLPNDPPAAALNNLRRLVELVLEPLREEFGPVIVSSGYRGDLVNAAVGGVSGSAHTEGRAADIFVDGISNDDLADYLATRADIPLEEVIVEDHTGHLHVVVDRGPAPGAREFLVTADGETYAPWWT